MLGPPCCFDSHNVMMSCTTAVCTKKQFTRKLDYPDLFYQDPGLSRYVDYPDSKSSIHNSILHMPVQYSQQMKLFLS